MKAGKFRPQRIELFVAAVSKRVRNGGSKGTFSTPQNGVTLFVTTQRIGPIHENIAG
jgi:hypothetical protein